MKKVILSALAAGFLSLSANAQVDKLLLEQKKKDKQKLDEAIVDAKKGTKAQTWMDRGVLYNEIAMMNYGVTIDKDTNASFTAVESFKKAIELDTKDGKQGALAKKAAGYLAGKVEDGIDLGKALLMQGAGKFQSKNYMEALKYFDAMQAILPTDTTGPIYAAYSAMQAQKNALAKPHLEKYMANGGKDPGNYGIISGIYRLDKEWDKALAALDKAIKLIPASATSLKAEKVNIFIESQRMADARIGYLELVELDKKNPEYPANLGILNDNEATGYQEQIKKLNATSKGTAKTQKALDDEKGKYDVFVAEQKRITDLMKKQPKNADLKRQLTDVQKLLAEAKTKVDEATAKHAEAQKIAQAAGDPTAKIAELTAKMTASRAEAVKYYNVALERDPKNYSALFNLAVVYFNDAVEMKTAVDIMEMKEYTTKGKEIEAKVCGRFKQAIPYFQRAKDVRSDDEQVNESLKMAENIVKEISAKNIPCEASK